MKIPIGTILQDLQPYEVNGRFVKIENIVNGRIGFGATDGTDRNIDGAMIVHTFVAANTEELIVHNLGTVPIGYLTIRSSNGGVIYDGTTRTSKTDIYLQSTTANNTVTLFILR